MKKRYSDLLIGNLRKFCSLCVKDYEKIHDIYCNKYFKEIYEVIKDHPAYIEDFIRDLEEYKKILDSLKSESRFFKR